MSIEAYFIKSLLINSELFTCEIPKCIMPIKRFCYHKDIPILCKQSIKKSSDIKLCVYSRNINIGDKIDFNGTIKEVDHFEMILPYGIWVATDDDYISAKYAGKIVGEVSDKAIFVKEFDEFAEEDIKRTLNPLSVLLGLNAESPNIFIIEIKNKDGKFY